MLNIEALNAHYGASHILHGVDLALAAGTISAVLGRNGVGKTTTLLRGHGFSAADERECAAERSRDRRLGHAPHRPGGGRICARGSADFS